MAATINLAEVVFLWHANQLTLSVVPPRMARAVELALLASFSVFHHVPRWRHTLKKARNWPALSRVASMFAKVCTGDETVGFGQITGQSENVRVVQQECLPIPCGNFRGGIGRHRVFQLNASIDGRAFIQVAQLVEATLSLLLRQVTRDQLTTLVTARIIKIRIAQSPTHLRHARKAL